MASSDSMMWHMKIDILHEDKHFLVINKPAGLVVHADGRTEEPTLVDWIIKKYPKMKKVGEPIQLADGAELLRPGIVHRLDRDTTGVLLLAKTQEAFLHAKEQFQNRTTKKIYRAFVYGLVKADSGQIDRPIGRSRSDFRRWTAQRGVRGEMREAVTRYQVLGRAREVVGVGPEIPLGDFSYIEVRPLTGRTHQIRVHMKAINHPLVEDGLYTENLVKKFPHALGFERLALHACQLEFTDMEGKKLSVTAPLPEDFRRAEQYFVAKAPKEA